MNIKKTKDEIIADCTSLLIHKGFNHTGISDILKVAEIPKGSFYNYFKNKEDFGLQVLDYLRNGILHYINEISSKEDISPIEGFKSYFIQFFETIREYDFMGGCPIGNLAQEMSDLNENFRKKTESIFDDVVLGYSVFLQKAKARNEISENIDILECANIINNYWQGTLIRLKTTKDRVHLDNFMKTVFEIILKQ